MIYNLEFINGLKSFVEEDLLKNFEKDFSTVSSTKTNILIRTDIQDIDEFRKLKTVLHVALIENDKVTIERNLYKREWRKFLVPAGINPTLAYVMCCLADLNNKDIIMDPFCGGGSIPIIATLEFNIKKFLASDISSKAVEYTKKNILEAKITKDKYSLFISDVKRLRIQKEYLDKIITNMPFGIRAGKHESNVNTYKSFFHFAYNSLKKEGLAILLTTEKSLVEQNIINKFQMIGEYKVAQGGLYPSIFVLKKL